MMCLFIVSGHIWEDWALQERWLTSFCCLKCLLLVSYTSKVLPQTRAGQGVKNTLQKSDANVIENLVMINILVCFDSSCLIWKFYMEIKIFPCFGKGIQIHESP